MNLPSFCIKRPVFSTVLSLILFVTGVLGYQNLQTRFFPRFERNIVNINTNYPGASASVVETTITTPLENALSGIEGVDEMKSLSSQGASSISLLLAHGTNVTDFDNNVHDQVALAEHALPDNVKAPTIRAGYNNSDLMDIGFSADDGNLYALRDYLNRNVIDRLEELPGVAAVFVFGANDYAMRITLHPKKMAALGISVNDIQQALTNSNLQLPAGIIKTPNMDFPVTANTELKTPEDFSNVMIKNINGKLIHLQDIATVTLGSNIQNKSIARINGKRAILLSLYSATNANPIDAAKRVRDLLQQIKSQLPPGVHETITFDQSEYMKSSITEVYRSITLAILCVGLIIFLSLGKARSSFIPIITIPVCMMATMGAMYFFGFSINIITLLAIVLSIGLVVDDAIVVLENIHRHMEQGMDRLSAAIQGSQEITTPVIAMTLTLAAVYAPIGLIKGPVSHIFASFAYTLASAVIISGFVALTLSPMMCAKFLPHNINQKNKLSEWVDQHFQNFTNRYRLLLSSALRHRLKIVISTLLLVVVGYFFIQGLPKTFVPKEDMGFLITILNNPAGTNNQYSEQQFQQLNQILLKNSDIQTNFSISSEEQNDNQPDLIFSKLKNYRDRKHAVDQIAESINHDIKQFPDINAFAIAPNFSASKQGQVEFYITAPASYEYLYQVGNNLIKKLNTNLGFMSVYSNIQFNNQQYELSVNRELANELQVNVRDIDNTVAALLGGSALSTFNMDGQTYDVEIQAAKSYLQNTDAILQFQVPSLTGKLIPLANLVSIKPILAQTSLYHYNRQRAAHISVHLAPNYSIGKAVTYLQQNLPQFLPNQVKYAFTGEAERIQRSSSTMNMIFILAFVFIYLVLSAQFESFLDPLIILLAVPLSVIGALVSLKFSGGSINIYTMIGLVTLVGLIAKHGILITQFANTLQKEGRELKEALIQAASIRLRPILMTTAAMVFGALPLVFATGASANSREQIGIVIVSGLLFGTFFSLILVPIAYSYIGQLKTWIKVILKREPQA